MMFLPLVVTPILSRIYTPADYGDWGVFSSLLYIVGAFILLSYENTIVKTNNENEIPNLVVLCCIVMVLVLIALSGVFFVGCLLDVCFFVEFPCFPFLILVLALSGIYSIITNLANRQQQYNAMVASGITNGLSQAGLRIFFGFVPLIGYGLIVGNVLAQVLSTVLLMVLIRKYIPLESVKQITRKGILIAAVEYKKFPLFDAPARFIEFAVGNLAIIVLDNFWDKDIVGCFSMVMQFVLIPISIIGSAMANVFYKELSVNTSDNEHIANVTLKAAKITFALAFLPIAFLALGGDSLLVLFLGDKWTVAGPIALCMSLFSVPVILSEPLLPLFRSLDRQEIRFRINLFNFVFSLGILYIVALVTHNIYLSLLAYSVSYAILRFIMYRYELKISHVKATQISPWIPWVVYITYGIVIYRLLPYII